jgi:hypothetical protein
MVKSSKKETRGKKVQGRKDTKTAISFVLALAELLVHISFLSFICAGQGL